LFLPTHYTLRNGAGRIVQESPPTTTAEEDEATEEPIETEAVEAKDTKEPVAEKAIDIDEEAEATEDQADMLIIGGTSVSSASSYPFYVAMIGPDAATAPWCNGALIARDVVLTAASCLDGVTTTYVGQTVYVGAYQLPFTSDGSQIRTVVDEIFQPEYNFGTPAFDEFKNDFLLLLLDSEVDIEEDELMRLSNYEEDMEPGEVLTVIGFGNTNPDGFATPQVLQQATTPVWFDGDCEIVYAAQTDPSNVDGAVEVCAGGTLVQEPSFFVSALVNTQNGNVALCKH
jgi:secreted trypsin-like serine protease